MARRAGRWMLMALPLLFTLPLPADALAAGSQLTISHIDVSHFPQVRATVSAVTAQGVAVADLDPSSFSVKEDGRAVSGVQVQPFVDTSRAIAVALLMDVSGSMQANGKLAVAKSIATAVVSSLRPGDSASLITFGMTPKLVLPQTTNDAKLTAAIQALGGGGNTALFDAVLSGVSSVKTAAPARRMLVLITDGDDTASHTSLAGAVAALNGAGSPVAAYGIGGGANSAVLSALAASSDGAVAFPTSAAAARPVFIGLEDRLRWAYRVSYTSHLASDGSAHDITIGSSALQQSAATAHFTTPATPPAFTVTGLSDLATVSGSVPVGVTITSGRARQVELLVDGALRSTSATPPYRLTWDTTKEAAGLHQVVVRVVSVAGGNVDQNLVARVAPLVQAQPKPVPTPDASPRWPLFAGISLVLVAAACWLGLLAWRARAKSRPKQEEPLSPLWEDEPDPDITQLIVAESGARAPEGASEPELAAVAVDDESPTLVPGHDGALPSGVAYLTTLQPEGVRNLALTRAETVLGRDPSSTVVIADPLVSRQHARISFHEGAFWIENLSSANGTWVNGNLVSRQRLLGSDRIRLGNTELTFMTAAETA
ncbi:MAG TPA: FHA domain-containing protein [Chloroflexota bacterium]|nr:FHA domain-containing protein [Chloroflexota bacterium]